MLPPPPSPEDYSKLDIDAKSTLLKTAWHRFQAQWSSVVSTLHTMETLLDYWSSERVPDKDVMLQSPAWRDTVTM